jgi:hypothetical protein
MATLLSHTAEILLSTWLVTLWSSSPTLLFRGDICSTLCHSVGTHTKQKQTFAHRHSTTSTRLVSRHRLQSDRSTHVRPTAPMHQPVLQFRQATNAGEETQNIPSLSSNRRHRLRRRNGVHPKMGGALAVFRRRRYDRLVHHDLLLSNDGISGSAEDSTRGS